MKRYFDLTTTEKLGLKDDDFMTAVKLEAVNRGIKPPLTIEGELANMGNVGFTLPPDHIVIYEVIAPDRYGTRKETGMCFKSAEAARASFENALGLIEDGYGATAQKKLVQGEFSVQERYISFTKSSQVRTQIIEHADDTKDFDALCEECRVDLQEKRQAKYNREVSLRKRAQYLELAQGNVEIAKSFWAKTEGTEFPPEEEPVAA